MVPALWPAWPATLISTLMRPTQDYRADPPGGQYPVSCAVASALATGFLVAIRLVECQASCEVLDLLCIAELRASCCTFMVIMSQCACDCQQFTSPRFQFIYLQTLPHIVWETPGPQQSLNIGNLFQNTGWT